MIKRLPGSPVHIGKLGQNIFSEKSHRHRSNTNVKILPQNRKSKKGPLESVFLNFVCACRLTHVHKFIMKVLATGTLAFQ